MSNAKYKEIGAPLTRVVEECSEVIKEACKIDRFGWFTWHPDDPKKVSNIEKLKYEMDDVIESFDRLKKYMRVLQQQHDTEDNK